jgi:hypothetical protein
VAGALIGTILLFFFLLGPVALIVALVVWLAVRSGTKSRSESKRDVNPDLAARSESDVDPAFTARFRELEDGILHANTAKIRDQKRVTERDPMRRRPGRHHAADRTD